MKMRFQKCYRKKKQEMKPGAILDQVISQSSSSANRCLLYKLANYKRGGDLIDAIQSRGNIAVEQLIREKFGIFTYKNGKGQMINRAEFLRWKYRDNHEVVIPIEASLSQYDPLGKWEDHKACWQMQYRGSLGESLLHVLIICDTKIHTKLARILLRVFPILALDVIEGEEYLGASALHLAIAYSNNELVADLVEAGANINQRAIGSFFLPRDQQRAIPVKNTDYEGLAYLGEYPLAWAACCANESVYNLLLDSGADPDAQDSFGNMILHMVVICDKLDMFGYALRHPKIPARNGMVNFAGLTPLTLACKLGRAEVFREMLELSAREFWRYSNITCSGYPLNALDTLLPDGRTNWNSALFIILNGTKEEHLDMLDGGIIQRLLEEKWKTFARNQFLKRLMILFMHLLFLSISVYLRPITENLQNQENNDNKDDKDANNNVGNDNHRDDNNDMDVRTIIRYCSELATIGGVLSYVIFQQGDEVKNQGFSAFLKQLLHDPAKAIFLVSNLLLLACIPFRIMGDVNTEEAILLFAVPGSWFLLMFFAGAVRLTGPFVTMIYSMLSGDMFTFGIIYTIVLFGFSQAFYFLFKGHSQVENTLFSSYPSTWMALFQTTLGDYNYPDLNNTSYPNLAKTVFVIFMIFVPILLLNMLIAMMGNTYAHVIEQSEKEWMKQWAKIVVTLERAVPQTDAQKYLEQYSIPLGQRDDSGFEQRGVMVIKSKSKTRAKQRKGAVTNWKRVGRVTLNELNKRGMTGEELRRIMWGRSSITSPTKIAKKKPKDAYNVIGAPNNALGTAVDIMSFTHDIVLCNKDPEKLPETTTTIKKKNVKNSASITTKDSKKIINNQPTVKKEISATQPPIQPDPLRELVIISEMVETTNNDYISNVKQLATQATALVDDKMITTTKSLPEEKIDTEIPTLTTIFQDPATMVDPEKERKFLQKLEELNDTEDSEGFVERPILGKISLARRAKSAVARTPSSRARRNESEISSATYTWNSQNTVQINDEINKEEKSQQQNDNDDDDDGNNYDNEEVTIEEVKRKTAEFHLKHRIAPPKSRSRSARNGRYKRHKNKISPENTTDFDNTAEKSDDCREESVNDVGKLQDPLEPWSTRNITNINEILGLK